MSKKARLKKKERRFNKNGFKHIHRAHVNPYQRRKAEKHYTNLLNTLPDYRESVGRGTEGECYNCGDGIRIDDNQDNDARFYCDKMPCLTAAHRHYVGG